MTSNKQQPITSLSQAQRMSPSTKKNILNNIFTHFETLRPIQYWLMPQKFKDLVNTIYNEHHTNATTKCFICKKIFINNFVRDFHLNTNHELAIAYTCTQCEDEEPSDVEDFYFDTVYEYHTHKIKHHDEKGYKIADYIHPILQPT